MDTSEFVSQNIYDRENFLTHYFEKFERSKEGDDCWEIMLNHLPKSVKGMDILEIGCGMGFVANYLAEEGAASVTGYDISESMIELAAKGNAHNKNVKVGVQDMETIELPEQQYDLVISLYAVHYVLNYKRLIEIVSKSLKPGGKFVLFVEHPVFTSSIEQPIWIERPSGNKAWTVSNYFTEGKRFTKWCSFENVQKVHRTVSTYIQTVLEQGLTLTHLEEFCPTPQQMLKKPEHVNNFNSPLNLNMTFTKNK
ncbi:hypothetical protein CYY_004062 [Polysphondylium violaceum]|uniref:Methyltransferase domain-containing protein n=1 Tax=Polysphondylium violaceum TaxID=133409 RepID=A0A8J4V0P0_9MYCE|nr:hypothetical protein CYY_004062 [Polysphondylium violaceum]